MATDYETNWGPRWRVTAISTSPAPVNIKVGDGLTFDGPGDGKIPCKLRINGVVWGEQCKHETARDQVEVFQSGGGTWDIKREKKASPSLGYKLTATQRSGTGASWTAEEGG